jgi:ABC-type branched-subunit amino acid transport system substrate-binding protein
VGNAAPVVPAVTQLANVPNSNVKKEVINVGVFGDFTGSMKDTNIPSFEGMKLCFEVFNRANELKNIEINIVQIDHQSSPRIAVEQVKKFSKEYNGKFIIRPSNTDCLKACWPFFIEKDFLILFPEDMFEPFKEYNMSSMVYLFPAREQEASVLLKYACDVLLLKKFAVFYVDDLIGRSYLHNIKIELEKRKLQEGRDFIVTSCSANTIDVKTCADVINKFLPEGLFLLSTAVPVVSLLKMVDISQIKYVFPVSIALGAIMFDFLKEKGLKGFAAYCAQFPLNTQLFEDFFKLYSEKKIIFEREAVFDGYSQASLFIEILKKINGPITKESILGVIKNNKVLSFKGMNFYFDLNDDNSLKNLQIEDEVGNAYDIKGNKVAKHNPLGS